MRDDMHSTFLEQKHYSSPLDCLEIKRRKTVAFIPVQDSFEILPKLVWEERFYKNHHQYILEVKPNFTPPLELPFLCSMQFSALWHFITATLSVSTRCTEHFLLLLGARCPKATPLLKAVKNKRHKTKAKSFILADKLKSSSDIAPIAEQVRCIRQLWLKNFFRWIQRLSQ